MRRANRCNSESVGSLPKMTKVLGDSRLARRWVAWRLLWRTAILECWLLPLERRLAPVGRRLESVVVLPIPVPYPYPYYGGYYGPGYGYGYGPGYGYGY